MLNTYPDYYKNFSCIADKCPDTCCAGWEIVIDSESLEKYGNLGGVYAEKIRSLISVDSDGDSIFTPCVSRCPFLLDNGLCEMYIELGHDSLCRTCRKFPRHTVYFGARKETGISLSCPEAARIIMENSEPIAFLTEEIHADIMPTAIDPTLYFTLIETRKTAINILQNRNFSINERLCAFLRYSELVQEFIDASEYEGAESIDASPLFGNTEYSPSRVKRALKGIFKAFEPMEFIDGNYPSVLSEAQTVDMQGFTADGILIEHLAVYFLHRYFITAAYDGRLLEKAIFAAVCTVVIMRISASRNDDFQTVSQKFSKEIEHSALNMEILVKAIRKSRCFSVENLINILSEKEK